MVVLLTKRCFCGVGNSAEEGAGNEPDNRAGPDGSRTAGGDREAGGVGQGEGGEERRLPQEEDAGDHGEVRAGNEVQPPDRPRQPGLRRGAQQVVRAPGVLGVWRAGEDVHQRPLPEVDVQGAREGGSQCPPQGQGERGQEDRRRSGSGQGQAGGHEGSPERRLLGRGIA